MCMLTLHIFTIPPYSPIEHIKIMLEQRKKYMFLTNQIKLHLKLLQFLIVYVILGVICNFQR